jgi:hypothetical protein
MFEAVAEAVSAPRAELFTYASRSATRCSSVGEPEGGGVWACDRETNATIPTSNRSRIITRVRYYHADLPGQEKWCANLCCVAVACAVLNAASQAQLHELR